MTSATAPVPSLPDQIESEEQLEELLSRPTAAVVTAFRRLPGDVILLGAGGKIGPSLARMARRAADLAGTPRRVIAVSRFPSGADPAAWRAHDIETIPCDLLDEAALAALPEAPNVFYLAGTKFGSTGAEGRLWAMNSFLPGAVCRKFRRSRIVAFSTGNVYGLAPVAGGGSREGDPPDPVGEYAMSCLGRERVSEHFSREGNVPVALLRLNYACDLRYGVLVDLAQRVLAGAPVDLTTGHFNTIWQGDANAMALQALAHAAAPPRVLNLTGPELLSVRAVSETFGRRFGRAVLFTGAETPTALVSNAAQALALFGPPQVTAGQLIRWVAAWVRGGGTTLGKPTKFESRDGKF